MIDAGTFTYQHDTAGRMVQAESVAVTLVYTYNANGLRVAQSVDGAVTTFVWDWASGIPEMLNRGNNLYLVGREWVPFKIEISPAIPSLVIESPGFSAVLAMLDDQIIARQLCRDDSFYKNLSTNLTRDDGCQAIELFPGKQKTVCREPGGAIFQCRVK